MEALLLLIVGLLLFVVIGSIRAFVAGSQIARLEEESKKLRRRLQALEREVAEGRPGPGSGEETGEEAEAPEPEPAPPPAPEPEPEPPPAPEPEPEPEPVKEPEPVGAGAPSPAPAAPKRSIARTPVASKPKVDWGQWIEDVVGKRWMTYAGGLAVFVSVGFFVKYAIDVGWIGPGLRVGAGVALGAAILVLGDRLARRGTRTFGLGLIGAAGLPILYVSLFAAFQLYDLLPQWMTFGAMVLVTAAGMFLSIRHDSLVVSFLALVGGLLTPSLVSTGEDSRDALFAYLILLDLGVLGIAVRRRWRSLDVLAFLGTGFYFAGWFAKFYLEDPDPPIAATLAWLGAFYAAFLILPFAWHLASRTAATLERFVMGLTVAAAVFWVAYLVLNPDHRHALGVVALVMAVCYAALGVLIRARLPEDRKAAFSFLAFAMTFLTIAGPLHFRLNGITVAWSAEAVLLLGLGFGYRYLPVRLGGLAVLGLAVGRLFVRHWPMHTGPFELVATAGFAIAAIVCAGLAAFATVHSAFRARAGKVDGLVRRIVGVAAGLLPLFVLHHEFGTWFSLREGALPSFAFRATGGAVYGVGALLFLAFGIPARSTTARMASAGVLGIGALIVVSTYPTGFPAVEPFLNARFPVAVGIALAALAAGLVLAGRRRESGPRERALGEVLPFLGALALVPVTGVDLWHRLAPGGTYAGLVGLTLLLTLSAAAFLAVAFRSRKVHWQLAALGLLGVATGTGLGSYDTVGPAGLLWFLNTRFAFALLVCLSWIGQGELVRRRPGALGGGVEVVPVGRAMSLIGSLGIVAVVAFDLWHLLSETSRYAALVGLAALFAVAAGVFLVAAHRSRSVPWRIASFALLVAATGIAWGSYGAARPESFLHFLNARFAVALLVACSWLWQGERTRRGPGLLPPFTAHDGAAIGFVGIVLLLLALSADLEDRLSAFGPDEALAGLAVLWAAGALACLRAGLRANEVLWRAGSLLLLLASGAMATIPYGKDLIPDRTFFVSLPWGTVFAFSAAAFAWGTMQRTERRLGEGVRSLAVLYLLLVTNVELHWFLHYRQGPVAARAGVTALNALAAAAFAAAGFRIPSLAWRLLAHLPLFASWVLGALLFAPEMAHEFVLFANARFVALVLTIGATFAVGHLALKAGDRTTEPERKFAGILRWLPVPFLFLVLSAEAWLWSKQEAADHSQARFAMQMALSVTWSVYAVALLLAGFRLRRRALRLTAIGLFAVTVAKLVMVDLASIEQEQIFRILSFFVAGVLMIGGSYLYHRVERRMGAPADGP